MNAFEMRYNLDHNQMKAEFASINDKIHTTTESQSNTTNNSLDSIKIQLNQLQKETMSSLVMLRESKRRGKAKLRKEMEAIHQKVLSGVDTAIDARAQIVINNMFTKGGPGGITSSRNPASKSIA